MKNLWEKTRNWCNEWISVIAVAIVCVGCLTGIYIQNKWHEVEMDKAAEIRETEVNFYKDRYNEIRVNGDKLFHIYTEEKINSQLKSGVIEKQQNVMKEMVDEINRLRRILQSDPDSWT
tara:strand:+ start:13643 stop:13999 length:357 start_codon:yes stop_codon:yes gene_type:complete